MTMHVVAGLGGLGAIMSVLTIQQILDSFEKDPRFTGKPPEMFTKVLGSLAPEDELIRKELPARLLRFEEGETAIVGAISDIRKDRDEEVLLSEGMDDSNFSGIVLYQHDYWRVGVPHARSLYREKLPKGNPYQVIAKTAYNVEVSDLGQEVYEYRKREYPLGQSVGFRSVESVRREQTGYEDIYKAWLPRVKAMYKELGIKAGKDDFSEPYRFFTAWELWEYSDVFVPSNIGAVQYAVSKGILTPDQARQFVLFKTEAEQEEGDLYALTERVIELEAKVAELYGNEDAPPLDLVDILTGMWELSEEEPLDLAEMWKSE